MTGVKGKGGNRKKKRRGSIRGDKRVKEKREEE